MIAVKKDAVIADEQTYIKNTKSMQKMQEIADRLALTTPELSKYVNPDAILKPNKLINDQQLIQPNKKLEQLDGKNKKKNIQTSAQQTLNKNEMTPIDWQRRCNELAASLQKEQDSNKILTMELNTRQERFVKREMEYRKIIEELQQELRSKTTLDQGDKKTMEVIYKDHSKIIEGINSIQLRTSKILVDQERDIIRFFNNKINEIKRQFEEERIKKGKKDQDYIEKENQLISELEWIKNIAQKIDNENHNLMKKYVDLKAQYQTQENDREMLLKELIMKKKKNAILKSQIEQYEKLLNDVQKEDEEEMEEDDPNNNQGQSRTQIRIRPLSKKTPKSGPRSMKATHIVEDTISRNVSQVENTVVTHQFQIQRFEKTIKTLQGTLRKEQKRVRELKSMYIKEMEQKSELEKILRKCVDDIKEEIIQLKGEARVFGKNKHTKEDLFDRQERDRLIERLLSNEKILTLLYDKTFYPDHKHIDIQSEDGGDVNNEQEPQMDYEEEDDRVEEQF